jgi:hypothetical protein
MNNTRSAPAPATNSQFKMPEMISCVGSVNQLAEVELVEVEPVELEPVDVCCCVAPLEFTTVEP